MNSYFQKMMKIKKGPKPLPILGNLYSIFKKGMPNFDLELTQKYGSLVDIFEGSRPVIIPI